MVYHPHPYLYYFVYLSCNVENRGVLIAYNMGDLFSLQMESNSNNAPESRLADINEQATPDRRDSQPTAGSNASRIPNRVISMHTGNSVSKLGITSTPRIDISRASSSSQQEDSRDSSPENVFDQVFITYN